MQENDDWLEADNLEEGTRMQEKETEIVEQSRSDFKLFQIRVLFVNNDWKKCIKKITLGSQPWSWSESYWVTYESNFFFLFY